MSRLHSIGKRERPVGTVPYSARCLHGQGTSCLLGGPSSDLLSLPPQGRTGANNCSSSLFSCKHLGYGKRFFGLASRDRGRVFKSSPASGSFRARAGEDAGGPRGAFGLFWRDGEEEASLVP